MVSHRKYLFAISGVAAFCVATCSSALTLGRATGSVNLGQPLKLAVPVQMEAWEGSSALCFEADVYYGDTRQDANRVVISSEWYPQSQSASVVVSSSSAVDEPSVTVYLRAGCESKTTRRYVLLSELAATVAPSTQTANPPAVSLLPRATSSGLPRVPEKDAETVRAVAKRAKVAPMTTVPAAAAVKPSLPKSPRTTGRRAHLKLAPLDLTQEFEPVLKLSNDLVVGGSEDHQKRAQAAALWGALNANPQEVLSAESLRQAMELDLKNLQGITAKNRQLLQDMTSRLDRAEAGRYSNPLVYGLFLTSAAICLVIAFLWNRARQRKMASEPWWRDDIAGDKSETVDFAEGENPQSLTAEKGMDQREAVLHSVPPDDVLPPLSSKLAQMDIDLELDDPVDTGQTIAPTSRVRREPVQAKPSRKLPRSAGHADFGHSMSATLLRSVNTKEMLDVRQQAEFFMTLGQHEEAIALLRGSVDEDADANPLVYLELFKVLHTLGLKAEYDHYRQGFNAIFSGHVPVYADFNQIGSGLEAYSEVCQQIVTLWPSAAAVSYIENCLVRAGLETGGQDFDLEAFRDLLMLHGVASRIASVSFDSGFAAFSAAKTAPMPVSAIPDVEIDFDLSQSHEGNLIDFDTSSWSPSLPGSVSGKAR